MTDQEQITSLREDVARLNANTEHISKQVDTLVAAVSAIPRLEADNKALDDLKKDVSALKDKMTWSSGAIAGLALFWPFIAKKLGIA